MGRFKPSIIFTFTVFKITFLLNLGSGPYTWLEIETLKNDQKPLAILSSIQV